MLCFGNHFKLMITIFFPFLFSFIFFLLFFFKKLCSVEVDGATEIVLAFLRGGGGVDDNPVAFNMVLCV